MLAAVSSILYKSLRVKCSVLLGHICLLSLSTNQRPPVLVTILLRARAETLMGPSRETPEHTQELGGGSKRGNALKCLTLSCYVWSGIVIHKNCDIYGQDMNEHFTKLG